ncbi:MAG TPA: hypothetical protein VGH62_05815, partial [Bradyrhizobium sp.]
NRLENPASRRLACSGCGTEFTCSLAGPCWCAEETVRLPMPVDGGDCRCRDCLRKAAGAGADHVTSSPWSPTRKS